MPPDLPGFYFDPEKNRYFPIKGPIPGSSRKSAPAEKSVSELNQVNKICRKSRKICWCLLQVYEPYRLYDFHSLQRPNR